jgi:hypothetical protein
VEGCGLIRGRLGAYYGASAGCCALKGDRAASKNLIRIHGNSTVVLFTGMCLSSQIKYRSVLSTSFLTVAIFLNV